MGKGIYSLLFLVFFCVSISAHAVECRYDTVRVTLKFAQGESAVDTAYASNSERVRDMLSVLDGADAATVSSVSVRGGASPEGSLARNKALAGLRARGCAGFVAGALSVPVDKVKVLDGGIYWMLLRHMIMNCGEDWRHDAVEVIDNVPESVYKGKRIVDSRNRRLRVLRGGKAWRYMLQHFFPAMRNAEVCIGLMSEPLAVEEEPQAAVDNMPYNMQVCEYKTPEADNNITTSPAPEANVADTDVRPELTSVDRHTDLFIKTNMLYDVAAVPNIGIEAGIGRDWSVGGNWMHAWWSRSSAHRYWRIYGGDVELRRWLHHRNDRSTSHSGHHLGLYGQILSYDIEFGGRGWQSDGLGWGVGLSYGYSLPVCRYFNLDFTIGLGYFGGKYKRYDPVDECYVWQKTDNLNWIGPTKAEISLVWIIGGRRKGGNL